MNKNQFKMILVEVGVSSNKMVEIKTAVNTNKIYISKSAYNLLTALKNSGEE